MAMQSFVRLALESLATSYFATGGFSMELCYTDFAARFGEFIEAKK
jgi:hypothetical protein